MSGAEAAGHAEPRLVVVTGLSGSGKSTVARCLEDLGYYCVDNLPLPMLRQFLEDPLAWVAGRDHLAVVTDMRAPGFAEEAPELLRTCADLPLRSTIVFLEASEDALLRRFSESRRPHPFSEDLPLLECIRAERERLRDLRGAADLILDSSDWSIHDARSLVYREFGRDAGHQPQMNVSLVSFGYKFGIPHGPDLLFDVRFLSNPHFVAELRPLTGLDGPVREYLAALDDFGDLISRLTDLLRFLLPRYQQENRSYLTIAVGCTGGQHRSVATVEALRSRLESSGWSVRVQHRELGKDARLIRVLIVTHGGLAAELLAAGRTIAGELPWFHALNLAWDEGLETARRRIAVEVAKLQDGAGVLILTDMYGSTPTNAALEVAQPGRVEVVSGVNLPMVVRLACTSNADLSVDEVARWLEIKGRRSISRAKLPPGAPRDRKGSSGD